MSTRFKDTYRGYLIDHHSPAPPIVTFENLDLAEYERFYMEAGINNLMVYCKDHWGYSYYNTATGYKHPALTSDWVDETRKILKRLDIEFNAYYCIEYDTTVVREHTDWSIQRPDGSPLTCSSPVAKWGMPCYLTGYRNYALKQLKEIVTAYHPDSLFLDIFGKSLCYCPECRRTFKERFGYDIPEAAEELNAHSTDLVRFLDDCAESFLDDLIGVLKSIDPELAITINFSSHYPKRIRDKLDYHFTEPWAGNWISAAYARDTGCHPQLGPGDVSKVFDYLPESVYRQAAAEIASQGCRVFMYSEPQRPDGSLEHEEGRRVGRAMADVAAFEHLLRDRDVIADIGIIQSDASLAVGTDKIFIPNAIGRARAFNKHVNALLGAMKCCDFIKVPWKVIPEEELDQAGLNSLQVILLPEVLVLSEKLLDKLIAFAAAGGIVLATGETGLYDKNGDRRDNFAFSKAAGIIFRKDRTEYSANVWGGYLNLKADRGLWNIPDTTPPIGAVSHQFSLKPENGKTLSGRNEVHGVYQKPATVVSDNSWVNWGYPPPKEISDEPLFVSTDIGKGKFWYAGFDFFGLETDGMNWAAPFLGGWINKNNVIPGISLKTEYPSLIGFTAFRRANGNVLVHIVSHAPAHHKGDAPSLDPGRLEIDSAVWPLDRAELIYNDSDSSLEEIQMEAGIAAIINVRLFPLKIHQIIELSRSKK